MSSPTRDDDRRRRDRSESPPPPSNRTRRPPLPRTEREPGTMGWYPPPPYYAIPPQFAGYPPPYGYYAYPPPPPGYFAMPPPPDFRYGWGPPPGHLQEVDWNSDVSRVHFGPSPPPNRYPYPYLHGGPPSRVPDDYNAYPPYPSHYDHRRGEGRNRRPDIGYPPYDAHYDHRGGEGRNRRPDGPAPHFRNEYGIAPPPQQGDEHRREAHWNNEETHLPNSEPTGPRSNAIITAGKILMAWEGYEFQSKLRDTYKCELTDCVIDMREWLDPLTSDNPEGEGCLIDLKPLRRQLAQDPVDASQIGDKPKELFLPTSIYVRQEMKGIFNLFCLDIGAASSDAPCIVKPDEKKTILLGSPGVGKSVLCFLAALYRSQNTVTIYVRRTKVSGEKVSVFIMFPENDNTDSGKVRCLFTRCMKRRYTKKGLSDLFEFLDKNLHIRQGEYYIFLDGPCYSESKPDDTLEGEFDYLCTSAGYPDFKNEEDDNSRRWCLNGWTQDEAEAAFVQMHGNTDEVRRKALKAYALCGGKIRQMCRAFNDYEAGRRSLVNSVKFLKKEEIEFCLYESSPAKINKLQIVFRDDRETYDSSITQFIDSKFIWKALSQKLGLERFVKEYECAHKINHRSLAGWHFESTVHAWFLEISQNLEGSLIRTVSSIDTSLDNSDDQLIKRKNQYWIPPSVSFRNIDSAIVIDDTLYAFQVTVSDKHDFNVITFYEDFLGTMKAFEITSVEVCVICTQKNFAFNRYLTCVNEEMNLSEFPKNLKHFGDLKIVPRDGWLHIADMGSAERFRQSMERLLVTIREREIRKRSTSTNATFGESNVATSASLEGHVSS